MPNQEGQRQLYHLLSNVMCFITFTHVLTLPRICNNVLNRNGYYAEFVNQEGSFFCFTVKYVICCISFIDTLYKNKGGSLCEKM